MHIPLSYAPCRIDGGRLFANLHPRANRYVDWGLDYVPLFARDNARIKNSLFSNGALTSR